MKKINLRETIEITDGIDAVSAYDLINIAFNSIIPEGINYNGMAPLIRIAEKLQGAKESVFLLLEDAEHASFVNFLKNHKWRCFSATLFAWIKSISELPECSVEEKSETRS